MNKNKELIKNTFILFLGKFCTQFISFLLIPIYTHYILAEDYGYIDLIQTYIMLLIPIIIFRLDAGVFRFLIDKRDNIDEQKNIITTSLIFVIFQIILFTIVFILLGNILKIKYFICIIINFLSIIISNILLQITRGIGKNNIYSISSIIAGISTLLLNIVLIVFLKTDGRGILISSSIGNILCSIYIAYKIKIIKYLDIKKSKIKECKKILKYSIPLIPDGLSWWIINVSDRTIISFILGTAINGIYSISCKFSNIITSIFQIFNMSWQESASLHINDEDRDIFFSGVLNKTYKIFYSICLLLMNNMYIIFAFFIGDAYKDAYKFIPILILANLVSLVANMIGGIYIAKKNTKEVARTTFLAAIINIVVNLVFIKKIGLYAATFSTIIAYIVLMIYRFVDVKKYVKLNVDYKSFIESILVFLISMVLYHNLNYIFLGINTLISVIYSVYLNFDIIKKILTCIRRKIKE